MLNQRFYALQSVPGESGRVRFSRHCASGSRALNCGDAVCSNARTYSGAKHPE
jgi:hypothetical protein